MVAPAELQVVVERLANSLHRQSEAIDERPAPAIVPKSKKGLVIDQPLRCRNRRCL
jgi:hypothetical protein